MKSQCFLQVFDYNGAPKLKGDSNFKDHIGWLTLSGWDSRQKYQEVAFVLPVSPVTTTLQNAASAGAAQNWAKATLDCFRHDVWFM
jgi:hypothetical protein